MEQLTSEALLLPKDQRLTLALRILASVEPEPTADLEAIWDSEIRERIARYDSGATNAIPGGQVFAELDAKLRK